MPETHRIEFKRELTPDLDLEKEVIAFLNYHQGGFIYIGIDNAGTRLGVADVDGDMLKIKDRIKHNLIPSAMGLFDVVDEEQGGVTCIKIIVASGSEKPYAKKKYGYCSLIKATKSVLDKLDLENKTAATITAKGRLEQRLWNPIALREAVINAIVHNDYTREVPPKFEIFADRIEITSVGPLPEGLSAAEFFEGYSIPRNKELMRIFKDLEMVEQLGSGIPRITQFFPADCFHFTENFLRMTLPALWPVYAEEDEGKVTTQVTDPVTGQVTPEVKGAQSEAQSGGPVTGQVKATAPTGLESGLESMAARILAALEKSPLSKSELASELGHTSISGKLNLRVNQLLDASLIERTIPTKPTSRLQKYRLTEKGRSLLK